MLSNGERLIFKFALFILSSLANICYSLFIPIFPPLAKQKYGLSMFQVGAIVASYYIPVILGSIPLAYMQKYHAAYTVFAGATLQALASFSFGFTVWLPQDSHLPYFFVCSLIIRIVQGLGYTLQGIGIFSLLASTFRDEMTSVIGTYEAIGGLSSMLGPLIGSCIYEITGFSFVFFSSGGLFLMFSLFTFNLKTISPEKLMNSVESVHEMHKNSEEDVSILGLLKIPRVSLALVLNIVIWSIFGFFETNAAIFIIDTFHLSKFQVGLYFCVFPGSYSIATYCAKLCPAKNLHLILMTCGCAGAVGIYLASCYDDFGVRHNLIQFIIGTSVVGASSGMALVQVCPEIFQAIESPNERTDNLLSGLLKMSNGTGTVLGAYFFGGYLIDVFEFSQTCVYYSFFIALSSVLYASCACLCEGRTEFVKVSESG